MPTLTTCPDARVLERLLLGQIPVADAEPLEAHVAACSRCAARLQQIRADDPLVEALRHTPVSGYPENTPLVQALIPGLKRLRPDSQQSTVSEETRPGDSDDAVVHFDFLAPAQAADELGRLGSYRVLKLLGAGGMGVVFLADDPRLKRRIALKVIKPQLVKRREVHERFMREAQAVARVEHDNIVTIFQVDEDRGVPFLAMPLLRGESLEQRLKRTRGPLPMDETLRLAREIASGLAAAHDHGLVHRDIKPGNIFLSVVHRPSSTDDSVTLNQNDPPKPAPNDHGQSKVKILDFGLARAMQSDEAGLSHQGQIIGTPAYMAPEQGRGQPVDHRADLFSLGCVLYRMTTGKAAFRGADFVSLLLSVAMDAPPPARELNPAVPPALVRLIDRLLAKNAEDRPPSAHAVVKAIEAIERERAEARRPKASRRALLIGTTAVLFAALLLGASLAWWLKRAPVHPQEKPGEITFVFDEPGVQLALQRNDEAEKIIDLKDSLKQTLPPGTYRLRPTVRKEGRELVPAELNVKPGETRTITLRLVGQIAKVGSFGRAVKGVAASPKKDDPTIVASSLDEHTVLGVWDGKSDDVKFPVRDDKEADTYQSMSSIAFAPDATHAATAGGNKQSPDNSIHVWLINQPRPKLLYRLRGHGVQVYGVAYAPDGKHLISGADGGEVFIWNLNKFGERFSLEGHTDIVKGVAFSADSKRALTGGSDKLAIVWNAETGKKIQPLQHPDQVQVLAVAFGPGATEATTAGSDGLIRIWDLKSDKIRELTGHQGGVKSVVVSPDGKRLLSGGEDGTIRLWDAETGREIYPSPFKAGDKAINSVAFTAEGRRAVSGGSDGTLRLWELPD
jgi:eukaryotic-like serine/threonine-protein kinase